MNKKKAIKIATASAIAASTFAATAPFQTEAAVNVSATVTNAANVMKAAQDFTTQGKVVSVKATQAKIDAGVKAYRDAKSVINKYAGSKKAYYTEKLNKSMVYLTNAKNYIAGWNDAQVIGASYSKINAAGSNLSSVKNELLNFSATLASAESKISKEVSVSATKNILISKYITPLKAVAPLADAYANASKAADAVAAKDLEAAKKFLDAAGTVSESTNLGKAVAAYVTTVKAQYEAAAVPTVVSVSAINAKEVKVTFSKDLSESAAETSANYQVAVNGAAFATVSGTPVLQSDKKSVIVPLDAPLANGNSFKVKVSGVRDVNLKDAPDYTTDAMVFSDTTKAVVSSADISGTSLELSFSEPVAAGVNTEVYIDGELVGTSLTDVATVGSYDYTVTGLTAAQVTKFSSVGTHKVDVYYVTDAASNQTVFTSVNYSVGTDTQAPSITGVQATGQSTFKVFTSEQLSGFTTANLTVKKGSYTFDSADLNVGAYNSTDKYYTVTVDTNATDVNNPLYASNETSVALSVEINGIKDAAGYVGNKFTGSVTLSKDTVAPKLVDNRLNYADTTAFDLYVKLDENVVVADASKITIRDKDGVKVAPATLAVAAQGKGEAGTTGYVKVDLTALASSSYTVEFAPGAIKDAYNNLNTTTLSSTVTVPVSSNGVTLPLVYGTDVTVSANTITINFGQTMDDSAKVLSNYKFNDGAFPVGTTINWGTDKQTVEIVLPANTFAKDTTGLVTVTSGVKTYVGKNVYANATTGLENVIKLGATDVQDNIAPTLTKAAYVVTNSTDVTSTKLRLTFSESVQILTGTATNDFSVVVNGKTIAVSSVGTGTSATDNIIELTLGESLNVTQTATVTVVKDSTNTDGLQIADLGILQNLLAAGSISATTKEQ